MAFTYFDNTQTKEAYIKFGFVLTEGSIICKETAYSTDILSIELLCARPGKQLMSVVKEKARDLGYKTLILSALGDEGLLDYYKALGFNLDQTLYLKNEVKCYNMYFILN